MAQVAEVAVVAVVAKVAEVAIVAVVNSRGPVWLEQTCGVGCLVTIFPEGG